MQSKKPAEVGSMTTRRELPDIARGALILLVVWGHLLEGQESYSRLYFAIYTFHIPAFVMISGAFSKSHLDASDLRKMGRQLLLPLVVFQLAYYFSLGYLAPDQVVNLYTPAWIIWFLFSLLTWKIFLPFVLRLPHPFLFSVFAALVAGSIDAIVAQLSLSRTFVFFPAFLFGHLYAARIFETVKRYRIPMSVLFGVLFCTALLVSDYVNIEWLWGVDPYSNMPLDTPGFAYRAIAITAGIITSVAFLGVLPLRSRCLVSLGQKTMPVYLLHGFPVMLFWASGIQLGNGLLFQALTALLSVAISFSIVWLSTLALAKLKRRP